MAGVLVAMAVLTEVLATVNMAGRVHITPSVLPMAMDLSTRKLSDLSSPN